MFVHISLNLEIQCKADAAAARADCQGCALFCVIIVSNALDHFPSAAIDRDSGSKTSDTDSSKKSASLRLAIRCKTDDTCYKTGSANPHECRSRRHAAASLEILVAIKVECDLFCMHFSERGVRTQIKLAVFITHCAGCSCQQRAYCSQTEILYIAVLIDYLGDTVNTCGISRAILVSESTIIYHILPYFVYESIHDSGINEIYLVLS